MQARSQDLEKGGGGYFERVRKVQTTLTRIFIFLESVSHGLSENWDEISRKARKFKGFFPPKIRWSPKNKKGLHRNWDWFFGRNRKFKRFFGPKSGGLQKMKKVFTEIETDFSAKFGNPNVWGGAIFNFSQKIGLKSTKNVRFCILHKPMGGLEPPRPPWLRYWMDTQENFNHLPSERKQNIYSSEAGLRTRKTCLFCRTQKFFWTQKALSSSLKRSSKVKKLSERNIFYWSCCVNWDCCSLVCLCRGALEKHHVYKKRAIKSKNRLGIFVSHNLNLKNSIFLPNLNWKKLN